MSWLEKRTIDGLPYYFNSTTEEITWDKPEVLMTPDEKADEAGNWVWIPHTTKLWQPGRLISRESDGSTVVQPKSGSKITIPASGKVKLSDRVVDVNMWPVKLSTLQRPVEDLVQMSSLNDASIINNIRIRYEKDELYTWVGAAHSVLISVNPYKNLPLYGPKVIESYRNKPPNTHFKPHVYDIANNSYNSLLFDNKDQSILISGESGSGKTVCTKQCLDFLAQVAGSDKYIESKILLANPLLEAFGNAQTIRNNNSSRFGKWIEVYFDSRTRKIASAKITSYLLEKSRLVNQAKNERNYHIFYQLTGSQAARDEYGLVNPDKYHYTNQSGLYKAHLIDDQKDFTGVKEAFDLLGFSAEEKSFVLKTTAGILCLGNCSFVEKSEKGGVVGSSLKDKAALLTAAELLGFNSESLEKVLCYRSITVRGVTSVIPLSPAKAKSGRDSFAMGIYSRIFDFLVSKINEALQGSTGKCIGVLDIFGFEIFEQNSFEQLCINFANEKLQQQFNNTTFKEEEALYQAEEIEYTPIKFYDNMPVLNMIEKPPSGILPLLDDECIIPEGSDVKFMAKMEDIHKSNDKFQTDKHRKLKNSFNFEIVHYAGIVQYNGIQFMEKNLDNLYQDMYDACANNRSKLFSSLFPTIDRRQMKSISYQFRGQLNELMKGLYQTESRYIRCVKPNGNQAPKEFNSFLSIDQLRYSGVFEAVDIRKQGYPFRYTYPQFSCRYSCINRGHKYRSGGKNYKKRCEEILNTSKQDFKNCVFGKTMVLFKTEEFNTLELLRNLALETLIPFMQKYMRGHLAREHKRRCLKLEADLQKAIKKRNDIVLITKAIDAINPYLGAFTILFPNVLPLSLPEATIIKTQLEEWIVLEKELNSLLSKDVNRVYNELASALVTVKTYRSKNYPETSSQEALVEKAIYEKENCTLGKIDSESEDCLKVLDLSRMAKVKASAEEFNHSTDTITKIAKILALPPVELVALELEKAIEMGDDKRRIHREIKLFHLKLEENKQKYDILKYPGLKDPLLYGKATVSGKVFGAQKKAAQMMDFTKGATPTSLTAFQGDPTTVKQLTKVAKSISKLIRKVMGDKALKAGETREIVGTQVIQLAMNTKNGMIEETYLQIVKQLRNNPVEASLNYGYELLGVFLGTALPEEELLKMLLVFIESQGKTLDKFNAVWHETKYGGSKSALDATAYANLAEEIKNGQGRSRFSIVDGDSTGPHI